LLIVKFIEMRLFVIEMRCASISNVRESWKELTVRGISALAGGGLTEAARCWIEAEDTLADFPAIVALRAAAQSNAGLGALLLGRHLQAERLLENADRSWRRVLNNIETLDVPTTGGSSSFHFRLATSTPSNLVAARKTRYRELVEAASGIANFHRAFASGGSVANIVNRAVALRAMVEAAFGASSPEARLLTLVSDGREFQSAGAIYREKLSSIRTQSRAAAFSEDCADLESAVTLITLLPIGILTSFGHPSFAASRSAGILSMSPKDV
jgi:hypothetical protein